jgi:hypothetical protein
LDFYQLSPSSMFCVLSSFLSLTPTTVSVSLL